MLQCVGHRVGTVLHAQFGQDRLDVVANGFGAEVQRRGDGGVAVAGGQQIGDLILRPRVIRR